MSWMSRHQMQPFSSFFIQLMSSREHTGTVVLTTFTVLSAQSSVPGTVPPGLGNAYVGCQSGCILR